MTALVDRAGYAAPGARAGRFSAMVVVANPFARESIVRALAGYGARDVLEAASLAEARARARVGGPREVVVAEVGLPDGSGLALVAELRAVGWVRGVVLAPTDDPYTVRAALTAGVRCYLVSGTGSGPRPSGNGTATSPYALGRPRRASSGPDGLSGREIEVLRLVADGQSNKDIGDALGLSALTVKSHLARIARKLGTGDRAEMVALSLRAGAIE